MRICQILSELMTPDLVTNQMQQQPPHPEQMSSPAAIKPNAQIDMAASKVPVKELFDVKAPVRQIDQSRYTFAVDGKKFIMEFAELGASGGVEVVLTRINHDMAHTPFDVMNDLGNRAVIVYSTAIAIIQKYLKLYQPKVAFLPGFGEDQQRIYLKMANYMLAKSSPEYTINTDNGGLALVHRQAQQPQGVQEGDEVLSRAEVNRIEHDRMSRQKPDVRNMRAVSMPGVPIHSPTPAP